jgi:hypothetical protein
MYRLYIDRLPLPQAHDLGVDCLFYLLQQLSNHYASGWHKAPSTLLGLHSKDSNARKIVEDVVNAIPITMLNPVQMGFDFHDALQSKRHTRP